MSQGYAAELKADFRGVGLTTTDQELAPAGSYAQLFNIVSDTFHIGRRPRPRNPHPTSELGIKVLELCETGVMFSDEDGTCCDQAEPRLLKSISVKGIINPRFRSPVIVTINGEPAGVIKQYGEQTCYGLADAPELGLYRSAFSSVVRFGSPKDIDEYYLAPPSEAPWTVEATDFGGRFTPLRFSIMATPVEPRRMLICDKSAEQSVARTTHEQIVRRAAALQDQALPLEP